MTSHQLEECLRQIETKKTSRLELLETQIKAAKQTIERIEADDGKMLATLRQKSEASTEEAMDWLNKMTAKKKQERQEAEERLHDLQYERERLVAFHLEEGQTRTALGRFFSFWKKAAPARQKELLRTLFEKIEVFPENQIRYTWRIPDPGVTPGVSQVVSDESWRGRRDSNPRPSA